jgi:uncharacterized OB-fold protein
MIGDECSECGSEVVLSENSRCPYCGRSEENQGNVSTPLGGYQIVGAEV